MESIDSTSSLRICSWKMGICIIFN